MREIISTFIGTIHYSMRNIILGTFIFSLATFYFSACKKNETTPSPYYNTTSFYHWIDSATSIWSYYIGSDGTFHQNKWDTTVALNRALSFQKVFDSSGKYLLFQNGRYNMSTDSSQSAENYKYNSGFKAHYDFAMIKISGDTLYYTGIYSYSQTIRYTYALRAVRL